MDTYVKAVSAKALLDSLTQSVVVLDGAPQGVALDVIGEMYKHVGTDKDGNAVLEQVPGYYANIRGDLSAEQLALLPVVPEPVTPYRVWA